MKFVYCTVVWGEEFVRDWLNVNLPFLCEEAGKSAKSNDLFVIYTDPESFNLIRRDIVNSNISILLKNREYPAATSYEKMQFYHKLFIDDYARPDTCLVFLAPDIICAEGTFDFVREKIESGFKAIVTPGLRTNKQEISKLLKEQYLDKQQTSINKRDLVRLALENLHPLSDSLFWDADLFNSTWPSHIYFRGPNGIRANSWHQHPLAVVMDKPVSPNGTLDADLLSLVIKDPKDIFVVQNSDDLFLIEMTKKDSLPHTPKPGFKKLPIVHTAWAERYCTPLDLYFFKHPVYWHYSDMNEKWISPNGERVGLDWDTVNEEADQVVKEITDGLIRNFESFSFGVGC